MTGAVREVRTVGELAAAIDASSRGVHAAVALIGGADFTDEGLAGPLHALFDTLTRYCESTGSAVVDGGTDTGVMRFMAAARAAVGGTFPLIGVAPAGALQRLTRTGAPIHPAPDHTLILLVPGDRFGDETDWLFAAADHLGDGKAPTLVVNGGALALDEAWRRLGEGHVVVAVRDTGRAADELAQALDEDPELRASGRLRTIPLDVDVAGLERGLAG